MDAYFDDLSQPFEHFLQGKKPTSSDKAQTRKGLNLITNDPVTENLSNLDLFISAAMLQGLWVERGITDQTLHIYLCERLRDFARTVGRYKNEFFYFQADNCPDVGSSDDIAMAVMWRKKGDSCLLHGGLFREYFLQKATKRPSLSDARTAGTTAYNRAQGIFSNYYTMTEVADMCAKIQRNYVALEDTLFDFAKRYPFKDANRGPDYKEQDIVPRERDVYIETKDGKQEKIKDK